MGLTLRVLKYFLYKQREQLFSLFEIIRNALVLALFDSFEYLIYGATVIINIVLFQCGDRLCTSESDVYRRQILTYKVGPRAERVIIHGYSIKATQPGQNHHFYLSIICQHVHRLELKF